MSSSIGAGRIHDRGIDCNSRCDICGKPRQKGRHVICSQKRAAKYRKDSK